MKTLKILLISAITLNCFGGIVQKEFKLTNTTDKTVHYKFKSVLNGTLNTPNIRNMRVSNVSVSNGGTISAGRTQTLNSGFWVGGGNVWGDEIDLQLSFDQSHWQEFKKEPSSYEIVLEDEKFALTPS